MYLGNRQDFDGVEMRSVLLLVAVFPLLITGVEVKSLLSPAEGNGSTWKDREIGRIESAVPADVTHSAAGFIRSPILPGNYFLPGAQLQAQRGFVHHRSGAVPYVYDAPYLGVGYPMAHALEHTVGPSPKHLVVVSFIGLLLLFAIIQNTIAAVKRREALIESLASRQKRDLYATYNLHSVTSEQQDILNDDARVRCIQRTVCLENRKLLGDLGRPGQILAKYLTRSVNKSLKGTPGWGRLVGDAGAAGLRGEDCDVLYRDCFTSVSSSKVNPVSAESEDDPN